MYDDLGRLIELQDLKQTISYYFNYDFHGNLISQTDNKGNQIAYDYDNLGNKQKEIVKQENSNIAFDFHYDYEMNEYNRDSFFSRLDRTYQDDIIIGTNGCDGLYGARSLRRYYRFTYDEDIKLNTMELGFAKQYLQYDLTSINSSRQNTLSHGGKFNKFLWNLNFEKSKAIYGWFKVLGIINNKSLIEVKGDNLDVKLIINDDKNLSLVANNIIKTFAIKDSILNNWIMPAVIIFNQNNYTKICLYLNGNYLGMISLAKELCSDLRFLLIGDAQMGDNDEAYSSANATPIRIAFMSIGSYHYKKINIKSIYDQSEHYFINADQTKKQSGVSLTTLNSSNYDFISFNGSFISNKGIKPLNHSYSDGAFKIDKTKTFIFDSELGRHVYGSYKGSLQLKDSNDSRLTYDLSFSKNISLSLSFKDVYDSSDESLRAILSITDSDYNEKIGIYIDNENNKIRTSVNGELRNNDTISVPKNEYHQITLLKATNGFRIYYDNTLIDNATTGINVEGCLLHLGCSVSKIEGREVVSRHLNGNIKDFLFNTVTSYIQILSQESICNKGSFTYNYDSFGRMTKEKVNINTLSYFKDFEYLKPKDSDGNEISNRTSTKVGRAVDSLGMVEEMQYDIYGNVTILKETKNNITKQTNYKYDGLFRLIESSSDLKTFKYTYDENGNIQTNTLLNNDEIIECQNFIYDENNHDKLISVITQKTDEQDQIYNISYAPNSLYPSYIGNSQLTWQGANLVEITQNENSIQFVYNSANKRIKKISQSNTINYLYDKDHLIAEQGADYSVTYIYDESNVIKGFVYSKNETNDIYGFIKNYLGVITGIIDETGNIICSYSYDDFGNVLNKTGNEEILEINHILYKGYYYDEEISTYMLGQRIYSPKLHRFISPDNFENLFKSHSELLQYNLFAYCDNNPIMRVDSNGQFWEFLQECCKALIEVVCIGIGAAIGMIVGTIVATVQAINEGKSIEEVFGAAIEGMFVGAGEGILLGYACIEDVFTHLNDDNKDAEYLTLKVLDNIITNHIIGFMNLADGIHNILTNPFITLVTFLINPKLGFIVLGMQTSYYLVHDIKSNDNYEINKALENDLIVDIEQLSVNDQLTVLMPKKTFNVIIDDMAYLSGQSDKELEIIDENNTDYIYKYEKYKFGFTNIRSAGCAIMAIYNMFKFLKKPKYFCDLIYYFERKNLIFGAFGAWPTHIQKLLENENIEFDVIYKEKEVSNLASHKNEYKCFVLTYWNQNGIGSAHTTCVIPMKHYSTMLSKYYEKKHTFISNLYCSSNLIFYDYEEQTIYINSNVDLFEVNGTNMPCKDFTQVFYKDYNYENVEENDQKQLPFDKKLISIFAIK